MYLIFDTETTGLPLDNNASIKDVDNWPRCVQLAWQLHSEEGDLLDVKNFIVKPDGYTIPFVSAKVHGITTERANKEGIDLKDVLSAFNQDLEKCNFLIGHNVNFDLNIVASEFFRSGIKAASVFDKCVLDLEKIKEIKQAEELLKANQSNELKQELKSKISSLEQEYNLNSNSAPANSIDTVGNWDLNEYDVENKRYTGARLLRPSLTKLYRSLFNENFEEAHNASADVEATARCFFELLRTNDKFVESTSIDSKSANVFRQNNPEQIKLIGLSKADKKSSLNKDKDQHLTGDISQNELANLSTSSYSHIHNHSSFSILSATTEIKRLVALAQEDHMPAVGITDHGNMYGIYSFVKEVSSANKAIKEHNKAVEEGSKQGKPKKEIKGIVGCELFIAEDYTRLKFTKDNPDRRFTQVLIAKNKKGYHNLSRLSSYGYTDGYYAGVPRIGKELVVEYKENLIALTGSLTSEIPKLILEQGEEQAEKAFEWWHNEFGEDFYVELIRHGIEEENYVNSILLKFAKKYNVKYIAQNNTYYPLKEDAEAHDILLCIRDGERKTTKIGRGREFRFGFPNSEFYFKSQQEMKELFADLPEAISNIDHIVEKIENFELAQPVLLPKFDIPEKFKDPQDEVDGGKRGENAYLRHLTFEGAKKRWGEITPEIEERLNFELATIEMTGYPGYFLIVQDFTTEARKMGVSVGPGRGSAAGSAVAYCTGITNIDPIKYDLLFERFLNPDRVSLPDIDIDFDDDGRQKIIDFVVKKYGKNQVAQIITYGTMAAKSSIRDAGRALDLSLQDTDRIAKLVPDINLDKLFKFDDKELSEKLKNKSEEIEKANTLKELAKQGDLTAEVINKARILEGSVRNTGIHACGVIITPTDIRDVVPVATAKDSDLLVTQFDNSVVESAGLLKMDFLGLKTLTLIKDAVEIVRKRHNIELIPDDFSLEDQKTYELFQRGETIGVFQYESPGMQKHLKDLKPTTFADIIAMNALYRPGPLEYIPSFIRRKHGLEEITYDIEASKVYLEETYGITVYQEQVMLLSQLLANFTKGEADMLRKAMGKKIFELLNKLKPKFLSGCEANGHARDKAEKIWTDWEAFASYAFNKSHSTCYAYIAFQTAYLKAHYPAEYMASVLSNNMNDIKQVSFFMEECQRMGIQILGPDINESEYKFTVNANGAIRFGMGAIKGVGEGAVESIVQERNENGIFKNVFDLAKRINLQAANKKAFENLVLAGGFDSFQGTHRAQYLQEDQKGEQFISKILKYGHSYQLGLNSSQISMFGEESEVDIPEPEIPMCEEWGTHEKLAREKEVVGLYISGHPLDEYKMEIKRFANVDFRYFSDIEKLQGLDLRFPGIVIEAEHRTSKNGNKYCKFTLADYYDNFTGFLFSEDYLKLGYFLQPGNFLFFNASVQFKNYNGKSSHEIKINKIQLLSELLKNNINKLTIKTKIEHLDKAMVIELKNLIENHPGSHKLEFKLIDSSLGNTVELELLASHAKIDVNKETLKYLKQIDNIDFDLS